MVTCDAIKWFTINGRKYSTYRNTSIKNTRFLHVGITQTWFELQSGIYIFTVIILSCISIDFFTVIILSCILRSNMGQGYLVIISTANTYSHTKPDLFPQGSSSKDCSQ